jgi:U3 small nucleolar RNA-associated protein 22
MDIYDDPMLDPPDSGSSDEDEGGVLTSGEHEENGVTDVEEGHEDALPSTAIAPKASTKGKGKSLYAPPTLQELDTLHPGTSTTFQLQQTALLTSTLIPSSSASPLTTLLKAIHSHILSLPPLPPLPPKKALKRLGADRDNVRFSGTEEFGLDKDVKWNFGWEVPEEVFVGGSWGVAGSYKSGKGEMGGVDLVVVMPRVSEFDRCGSAREDY